MRKPPECPVGLQAALDAARCTPEDVAAYWENQRSCAAALDAMRRSEAETRASSADGLVSYSTSDTRSSFNGLRGDPGAYWDWVQDQEDRRAWSRAVDGLQVSGVAEYSLGPSSPVVPVPDDLVLDAERVRLNRARNKVMAQAGMIQGRLSASRRRWRVAFLTLTYRDEDEFDASQISLFIKRVRQWSKRRGFDLPYIWVLERGETNARLHYHVVVWLPSGVSMPKPDKQGWWVWGMTRIEWARSKAAAVGYLAKYAAKCSRADFPSGARIHGAGGLTALERCKLAWGSAPAWVRDHWPSWESVPRPAKGGGWVSRVTGEWLPSPWQFVGMALGGPVIRRVEVAV